MKLLIIDDHPLVRSGLVSMLSNENSLYEVKEAGNMKEA
jgi:DNA-binding NarL/FixJ family response regulator